MVITDLTGLILKKIPSVRTNLKIAHNRTPPAVFVKKSLRLALFLSVGSTVMVFFLFAKQTPILKLFIILILTFTVVFFLGTLFILQTPQSAIRKRQRDIDKDVLFAGRYLLVKLESGTPLVNTFEDASKGYGISAKYFREIVDDINTGVPVELALENARTYNASDKFKRILWQLVTSLKIGSEVSQVLKGTLKSIAAEQVIEIKEYGKKLNSLMLFYMIIACVGPSLGLTMLIIISGFLNLEISNIILYLILFFLAVIQIAFIVMVKAARPLVEL